MLLPGLNANAVLVFNFFHYEGALNGGNVFVVAYDIEQELLIVFHVGGLYAQKIVETARNIIAFCDFFDFVDEPGEGECALTVYGL